MSEFRIDPLSRKGVIIAGERAHRPFSNPCSAQTTACPFCKGNEEQTPSATDVVCYPGTNDWTLRCVPNKYPAVSPCLPWSELEFQLSAGTNSFYNMTRLAACGRHEVIIESPRHDKRCGLLGEEQWNGKRVTPSLAGLDKLLHYYGVELQPETLKQIWDFHQLLRANNDDQDLTRLNAFETMVERHYADCTLINAYVPKWPARMIDVGSGAGFPGIPLKIVNPSIQLTLCEPRPNRINFLNMVIEKMGLKGIDVFGHKVTSRSMTIPVDGVISRAFELMEKTLPRIANSLKVGGRVYFMKGPAVAEELKTFYPEDFGYKFIGKHFYTIPNSTQDRALIILEREE